MMMNFSQVFMALNCLAHYSNNKTSRQENTKGVRLTNQAGVGKLKKLLKKNKLS